MDLQFCIMCVLISTCKLWLIKENIKEVEVFDLIRQSFSEEDRITIAQILRWVAASDEVKSYFNPQDDRTHAIQFKTDERGRI